MANSVSFNNSIRFQAAFEEASRTTGTDFEFLLNTAKRESNFNASAKAPTSSASGLFQFVEQTWLETMKEAGPQLGFSKVASQISQVGDKYYVRDPEVRQQILNMRNDPQVSAMMAGAYAQSNREQLAEQLNRTPSQGELYAAHFLGAQGSSKLITMAEETPNKSAAAYFPAQAEANKNIFFDRQGNAKSVSEVYSDLVSTASGEPASAPKEKKGLLDMLGLGNLFTAKESTKQAQLTRSPETPAIQTQHVVDLQQASNDRSIVSDSRDSLEAFFSQPLQRALPSRYGLSYLPDNSVSSQVRASRFVAGDDGQQAVEAASASNGVIASRIYAQASEPVAAPAASETEGMALPKRKPAAAEVTADVYVDSLAGALPRAKPQSMPTTASVSTSSAPSSSNVSAVQSSVVHSAPLDLTRQEVRPAREQARLGALDLSAFLRGDVFSSSDKG
ncbi:hypothetical protein [Cohaesibacter marisflavi]|uniref:hypothetical protein n=1 Tax=Cohaesibacter marisflavi TaxID=655353 RepID=UPI001113D727|nr:hypothetical protein [Cohaesibacter marisflavi]